MSSDVPQEGGTLSGPSIPRPGSSLSSIRFVHHHTSNLNTQTFDRYPTPDVLPGQPVPIIPLRLAPTPEPLPPLTDRDEDVSGINRRIPPLKSLGDSPQTVFALSHLAKRQNARVAQVLEVISDAERGRALDGSRAAGLADPTKRTTRELEAAFERSLNDIHGMLDRRIVSRNGRLTGGNAGMGVVGGTGASGQDSETKRGGLDLEEQDDLPNALPGPGGKASVGIDGHEDDGIRRRTKTNIVADLEAKLNLLRDDPEEWARFQDKITTLRSAKHAQSVKRAGRTPRTMPLALHSGLTPREKAAKREAHREAVAARALAVYNEQQHRRTVLANRAAAREAAERAAAEAAAANAATAANTHKWLVMVALSSRVARWGASLTRCRENRTRGQIESAAARVIQRNWRVVYWRVRSKARESAGITITAALRRAVTRRRAQQRRKAAQVLVSFLSDVAGVTEIVMVMRRFRLAVVRAQLAWRSWAKILDAQTNLIMRQTRKVWAVRAPALRSSARQDIDSATTRERALRNALVPTRRSALGNVGGTSSTASLSSARSARPTRGIDVPPVPEAILAPVIRAYLRAEKRAHVEKMESYWAAVSSVTKERLEAAELEEARAMVKKEDPSEMSTPGDDLSTTAEEIEREFGRPPYLSMIVTAETCHLLLVEGMAILEAVLLAAHEAGAVPPSGADFVGAAAEQAAKDAEAVVRDAARKVSNELEIPQELTRAATVNRAAASVPISMAGNGMTYADIAGVVSKTRARLRAMATQPLVPEPRATRSSLPKTASNLSTSRASPRTPRSRRTPRG